MRALTEIVDRELTIAVLVEAIDQVRSPVDVLLPCHLGIAIAVERLKAVDHRLSHHLEPQPLIFVESQCAVAVAVEPLKVGIKRGVDLGLHELTVIVSIITLEECTPMVVMVALVASPASRARMP